MSQDVVSLLFPGDSADLLPAYAGGARSWHASGMPAPDVAVVAHADQGLLVTLVWGEGMDHHEFGAHMLTLVQSGELPRPQVQHGVLATQDWAALQGATTT